MSDFKPCTPYNVPFHLLIPETVTVKGVKKKEYKKCEDTFFCSFRTFGGTEKLLNDNIVVENTAVMETWFDPRITSGCMVELGVTQYEIIGTPENINMRNQWMVFKVRAVKGGA